MCNIQSNCGCSIGYHKPVKQYVVRTVVTELQPCCPKPESRHVRYVPVRVKSERQRQYGCGCNGSRRERDFSFYIIEPSRNYLSLIRY